MARVLSGIQPSGGLHLGNYLGALRRWVARQDVDDAKFCIVDLHALTLDIEPDALRSQTVETAIGYLAAGIDPARSVVFVQSHVPEHTELTWLLECTTTYGELQRMTQFKDKAAQQTSVRAGLFTYPVLMAADILAYDTERVPVGDDQRQHLELTRNVAIRFNARYGDTFVVPDADIPAVGARIMDLQRPTQKMSKSTGTPAGTVFLTDDPDAVARKIRRAVTDPGTEVVFDPDRKPGVSNLLEILAAAGGGEPVDLASRYGSYGALKADCADAVVAVLDPLQRRMADLAKDPGVIRAILAEGAERARKEARRVVDRARDAMGLLARP